MSKTAARRVALFASSSFGLAAIASAASLGAALIPTAAAAQTVTCTPLTAGDGTADVVYPAGTYNPGITCFYTGDGGEVSTSGAITVSTSGGVPGNPLVNGINLRPAGTSDDISWDSTAGTVSAGSHTNGPIIDALTAGDITVRTGSVSGSLATITDGVRAISTGGGAVTVNTGAVSLSNSPTRESEAGIRAVSTGGNGDVSVTATGSIASRLYGIYAVASGSGDLSIQSGNIALSNNFAASEAAIYAQTGSGMLTINAGGLGNPAGAHMYSALRVVAGGDADITFGSAGARGLDDWVVDLTLNGAQSLVNGGTIPGVLDSRALRVQGGSDLTMNLGGLRGGFDFSGLTGDLDFSVSGLWYINNVSTGAFGSGSTTVTLGPDGVLHAGLVNMSNHYGDPALDAPNVFDFSASSHSTFINAGVIAVGSRGVSNTGTYYAKPREREGELRLVGLDTFRNSGTIILGIPHHVPSGGANQPDVPLPVQGTDRWIDDMLVMEGATFVGEAGSRILLDALLTGEQLACDASIRDMEHEAGSTGLGPWEGPKGDLPAADCVNIQGGATEGVTNILIHQIAQGDRGSHTRIVLVDVSGGTSAAGHFVLDPENVGYNPDQGGFIDLGYIIYPLVYDAETQQHVLLGVGGVNAWQNATWASAVHDLWRVTTGSWFDRQADLRGSLIDGVGGGVWLRTSAEFADRGVNQSMMAGTSEFNFDNSFEQSTYAVTGGLDVMAGGGANSAWVLGVMAGYANSELKYDTSPNTAQFDGWTGGLYASYLAGGLFVDAAVNGNKLDVKADIPDLNLFPAGTLLDTRLLSVGGQVEAGWRFPVAGAAFIEPLAGVSYVQTRWDDLPIASSDPLRPGVDVSFDDPTSLRANIGARLGLDQNYGGLRAQYSVLGRLWNEFEGEHNAALKNIGEDYLISDAFTGQFTEFGVGVSLYGPGEAFSGFFNYGGKFGDDYDSKNLSAGVRVNW